MQRQERKDKAKVLRATADTFQHAADAIDPAAGSPGNVALRKCHANAKQANTDAAWQALLNAIKHCRAPQIGTAE